MVCLGGDSWPKPMEQFHNQPGGSRGSTQFWLSYRQAEQLNAGNVAAFKQLNGGNAALEPFSIVCQSLAWIRHDYHAADRGSV